MDDHQERKAYMVEYRAMLKAVLVETIAENNSQVRSIFKEAIKEWLTEQMQDGGAWAVRLAGACFVIAVLWVVLNPKK